VAPRRRAEPTGAAGGVWSGAGRRGCTQVEALAPPAPRPLPFPLQDGQVTLGYDWRARPAEGPALASGGDGDEVSAGGLAFSKVGKGAAGGREGAGSCEGPTPRRARRHGSGSDPEEARRGAQPADAPPPPAAARRTTPLPRRCQTPYFKIAENDWAIRWQGRSLSFTYTM
jgi:hypothetical protein